MIKKVVLLHYMSKILYMLLNVTIWTLVMQISVV